MIAQILPLLSRFIPPALAAKGLAKISPRIGSAIEAATAAGYGTDAILDYLRKSITPEGITQKKQELERGAAQGNLTPQEIGIKERLDKQGGGIGIPLAAAGLAAGLAGRSGNEEMGEMEQGPSDDEKMQQLEAIQNQMDQGNQKFQDWYNKPTPSPVSKEPPKMGPPRPSLMQELRSANQPGNAQAAQQQAQQIAPKAAPKAASILPNQAAAALNIAANETDSSLAKKLGITIAEAAKLLKKHKKKGSGHATLLAMVAELNKKLGK